MLLYFGSINHIAIQTMQTLNFWYMYTCVYSIINYALYRTQKISIDFSQPWKLATEQENNGKNSLNPFKSYDRIEIFSCIDVITSRVMR